MSTLRVNTLQDTAGVERYTARAWVNFNGTGTVAIRASGNVSSITDNGTGDYTVNFTTALPDANYSGIVTGSEDISNNWNVGRGWLHARTQTTTTLRINFVSASGTAVDAVLVNVGVFR